MPQPDFGPVGRHLTAALLVAAAMLAGRYGSDGLARLVLLFALSLVSVTAIMSFAQLRSGQGDDRLLQPLLSTMIAGLLLLSCVLRSSTIGPTPHLAVSSLGAALALYALKGFASLAPSARRLVMSWPAKP